MYKTTGTISRIDVIIPKTYTHVVIGIDPGLQNLGIGIIWLNKPKNEIAMHNKKQITGYSYAVFKIKQQRTLEQKLAFIFDNLCELFTKESPTMIVVEDAFIGFNKGSSLKLGIVRGCILTAIGKMDKPIQTLPPKTIKMQITQKGDADKLVVFDAVGKILTKWKKTVPLDASDALAAALSAKLKIS